MDLQKDYQDSFKGFLKEPESEAARAQAYELGRRAIGDGKGLLDLAAIQEQALEAAAGGGGLEFGVRAAFSFLAESMAPYEMLIRGFLEANQKLQAANQELEAFNYSVAHDLKAPLRGMGAFSRILADEYGAQFDEDGKKYLALIQQGAADLARMIDALMALSRLNRAALRLETVDFSALAEAALSQLRLREPQRRVETVVRPGMQVTADPGMLKAAVDNLLANAWKFTSREAEARIEVGRQVLDEVTYFVSDNGVGFDSSTADRLFAPFQRLHAPAEFEGHGIGLATVQRIVARHGGRIWAESQPGSGATFRFTLNPKPF